MIHDVLSAFKTYGPDIFYADASQLEKDATLSSLKIPPTDKPLDAESCHLPHPRNWLVSWIKPDFDGDPLKPLLDSIARLCRQILLAESKDNSRSLEGFDKLILAYQEISRLLQDHDKALAKKYHDCAKELEEEQFRRMHHSTNNSMSFREIRCQKELAYPIASEELSEPSAPNDSKREVLCHPSSPRRNAKRKKSIALAESSARTIVVKRPKADTEEISTSSSSSETPIIHCAQSYNVLDSLSISDPFSELAGMPRSPGFDRYSYSMDVLPLPSPIDRLLSPEGLRRARDSYDSDEDAYAVPLSPHCG